MSWQPLATIQLSQNWQLTEPILGNAFRLKHSVAADSPQELRAVIAQAYDEDNLLTYFNDKVITFRTDSQGFVFPQIAGILNRKFAFKRLDNLADAWTITIEVLDGMPESISLPIAVSEVVGLQKELNTKEVAGAGAAAATSAITAHKAEVNPHPQYATNTDINTIATALTTKEEVGTAANAIATHEGKEDPHPQYATDFQISNLQNIVGGKEAVGVASNLIIEHEATANHPLVTTAFKGMMSAGDKIILNKVNNYPILNVLKNSQSITTTADTLLTFSTIISDSSNSWNAANNQWTCPQTGTYSIGAIIEMLNNATVNGEGRIKLYKNNVQVHRLDQRTNIAPNFPTGLHGFVFMNLVVGDLIDIRFVSIYATSSAPITISASNSGTQYCFMAQRIK